MFTDEELTQILRKAYPKQVEKILHDSIYIYRISTNKCLRRIKQMYKLRLKLMKVDRYIIVDESTKDLSFRFRKNISNQKKELIIGILRLNGIING